MRLLNLCSGTGSVSVPFRENGWEVVEVDWDDRFGPTHVVDITTWDYTVYPHDFFKLFGVLRTALNTAALERPP